MCPACLAAPEPLAAEYMCAVCRAPFASGRPLDAQGVCRACRDGMHGFDAAYSFGFYEGTLRKLIHLLKYSGVEPLAGPLARMLARAYPRGQRFDLIAPMPMHWRRRLQRGFNQSDLLARALGKRLGIPVRGVVRRSRWTPPQAGRTGTARRANVAASFDVRGSVKGLRILLVDDVLTTGATAGACARAMKRAGAAHVAVLTVARADRRGNPERPEAVFSGGETTRNADTRSFA